MQKSNAIVITGGYLDSGNAKTAHGLIRGSDRFNILAIIDHHCAGQDAGVILDGTPRNIPVFATIDEFGAAHSEVALYCVIGVATKGGVIPPELQSLLKNALEHGLSIVNGLHEYVSEIPELAALARGKGLALIDVRKPKKVRDLHFWSGKIAEVKCPRVAVLGTDCALGKRTTTRILVEAMRRAGYRAEMVYTGQTGWMQGARYGFIFDSTLNDFISGEMEHAVYSCYTEEKPDIIFIEGQSSLRNPSGPAGAEWIVSAGAASVVLQHNPARRYYKGFEFYPAEVAQPEQEIELIRMYGARTVAVTLNTAGLSAEEAETYAASTSSHLKVPVVLPLEHGVESLVPLFETLITQYKNQY